MSVNVRNQTVDLSGSVYSNNFPELKGFRERSDDSAETPYRFALADLLPDEELANDVQTALPYRGAFFNSFKADKSAPGKGGPGIPFLPSLEVMAESGPFLFMAMTLLNLLEVAPRPSHLNLICTAVKGWLAAQPENREFWIGQAVGRRVCALLEAILKVAPAFFVADQPARRDIDDFIGKLIRLGVAEAHRLEESIRKAR